MTIEELKMAFSHFIDAFILVLGVLVCFAFLIFLFKLLYDILSKREYLDIDL